MNGDRAGVVLGIGLELGEIMTRILPAMAGALLLSSCAELYIAPIPATALKSGAGLTAVRDYATGRAADFRANAHEIRSQELQMDSGLLVAAMGAAATLLYVTAPAQADVLGGIGLGAGGLSAWRTRLSPKDAAIAYETAARGLDCVIQKLVPLTAIDRTVERQRVQAAIKAVIDAEEELAAALEADGVTEGPKPAATKAVEASLAVKTIAAKVRDALDGGETYAIATIHYIEDDLASALDKQTIDFASLRDSLVAGAQAKAQNQANAATASAVKPPAPGKAAAAAAAAAPTPDERVTAATENLRGYVISLRSVLALLPLEDLAADLAVCRAKPAS